MNDETRLEMSREEVLSCAGATKTLPMLNGMMNEVFSVMEDPDSSFSQLFRVVRYDQAISSKIISIANSTYYCRGASVTNLERAMIVVGFEEIKRIIMCLVFMKGMTAQWHLAQDDIALMWGHSLTVAHAAKSLSTKMIVEEPGRAFTVAILHDIGKAVFYAYGERYRRVTDETRLDGTDVCELERAEFGIDHQEVGHYMSVRWGFPEVFSTTIRSHHGPHDGEVPLVDIIRDADAFASGREDVLPAKERAVLHSERESIKAETERIRRLIGV